MNAIRLSPFLRKVLLFDASTCVLTGVVMLSAAPTVEQLLAIPAPLSRTLALLLLIFGGAVAWVGTRDGLMRGAVWTILILNALWAIESLLALGFRWLEPTAPGRVFIIVQAIAVGVIAALQFIGLRRARTAAA
jgi:hypothetical protein